MAIHCYFKSCRPFRFVNLQNIALTFLFPFQIYELHSKNLDLEKRNDKAEFESKRAKEKQQMLEAENEVYFK